MSDVAQIVVGNIALAVATYLRNHLKDRDYFHTRADKPDSYYVFRGKHDETNLGIIAYISQTDGEVSGITEDEEILPQETLDNLVKMNLEQLRTFLISRS